MKASALLSLSSSSSERRIACRRTLPSFLPSSFVGAFLATVSLSLFLSPLVLADMEAGGRRRKKSSKKQLRRRPLKRERERKRKEEEGDSLHAFLDARTHTHTHTHNANANSSSSSSSSSMHTKMLSSLMCLCVWVNARSSPVTYKPPPFPSPHHRSAKEIIFFFAKLRVS